jgi:Immunity protein Imm5
MSTDPLFDEALRVVEADPDGHLPLRLRRRIRRRFGPVVGVANGGPTDGLRAVVRLDRLAAERVQRHWDAGTGGDGGFRRMLDLADEPDYDPAARRAFWRWYLGEAIPSIDQDWHH